MASPQAGLIAGHIRPTDCVVRLPNGPKWRLTRPGPHGLTGELAQLPNGRVTGLRLARTRGPPAGELVGGGSLGGSPGGTQPGSLVGRALRIVRSRCPISKHILAEITPGLGEPPLRAWSTGGLHEAAALASRQVPDFWSPDGQPTQAGVSEPGCGRNLGWPRTAASERGTRGSQPACRFGRISVMLGRMTAQLRPAYASRWRLALGDLVDAVAEHEVRCRPR